MRNSDQALKTCQRKRYFQQSVESFYFVLFYTYQFSRVFIIFSSRNESIASRFVKVSEDDFLATNQAVAPQKATKFSLSVFTGG